MYLSVLTLLALVAGPRALPRAIAGEVPSVDGVLGGVLNKTVSELQNQVAKVAWENPLATPGAARVVENTGICEHTSGVYEAAGYVDLTKTDSIWFWFFAARNNPDTAPLVLWFNGGPGSSSMFGLFQEHGPCFISNDSSTFRHNAYSWTTNANIMYIDQPAGVGFSVTMPARIRTSAEASVDIWAFLQIWLKDPRFKKFVGRDTGIWTESYGGHYGPAFAKYFLEQNAAIASNAIEGTSVNLTTLGIGNGLTDPLSQYSEFANYAANNPYHPLVNSSVLALGNSSFLSKGGCRDRIVACNSGGSNAVCSDAQSYCNSNVLSRLNGNRYDTYYILSERPNPYPADFSNLLNTRRGEIQTQKIWVGTNYEVYNNFASTGDWMRSSKGDLEGLIDFGLKVIIYSGDADYIINYFGTEAMMDNLETKFTTEYKGQALKNYTVDGTVAGVYKNAGTLSYLRVHGAGHLVPAYGHDGLEAGHAALRMFEQIQLGKDGLVPT
ncbi:alpha/beta-hydrolase [Coprinellus micaceus]|uniref:Carboxypeptidase n=1 Tax=Coprinellus micaceus TaxID=71717 RepID=A0A4Y7SRG4_COPMI|nr:alpha/beta-hydrolase [Coprinellus micaceus]